MTVDRPSIAKKSTAAAALRRQAELDAATIGIIVDGEDYIVNPADITGVVELKIRRETGYGLAELAAKLEGSPGVDLLGMFMWAVRLSRGEEVDLMDVLAEVSHGSIVERKTADEAKAAVDAAPKA